MDRTSAPDHVVFISVDTMRSDVIAANPFKLWPHSYDGLVAPRTDVLDDLVGRGAFFPNTISAAPYTAASHGAIFTGQYPLRNGLHEFYNGGLRAPTVFTYGRRAGRRTVMKVDFPIILGPELGFTRDIDVYLDEKDDEFVEAVASQPATVALAHFGGVHVPYGFHSVRFGGAAYRDKVAELEASLPIGSLPFTDRLVETFRAPEDTELLLRYKRAVGYLYAEGRYQELMRLYLDGVEFFLRNRLEPFVERLIDRVARTGRKLLLVLFADHGEEFDEYSNGHFNSMAEGVLRVPLIIVGDGVAPQIHAGRIRTVDIAPTMMELAGIATPATGVFDGRSLAGVVRGEAVLEGDSPALAEAYTSDLAEFVDYQQRQLTGQRPGPLRHVLVGQAAYLGRHRLVRLPRRYTPAFAGIEEVEAVRVERFDENLVPQPDPGHDATALVEMLDDYRTALRPTAQVAATDEIRNQLRSLGYTI
jgi:choline-sulfatase